LDIEDLVEMPTKHRELKGSLIVEIPIKELSHKSMLHETYTLKDFTLLATNPAICTIFHTYHDLSLISFFYKL